MILLFWSFIFLFLFGGKSSSLIFEMISFFCSNKINFLFSWCIMMNGIGVINMLMVIFFVSMFNSVYSYIMNFSLVVFFYMVFVVCVICFEYWFFSFFIFSNLINYGFVIIWDNFFWFSW